MNLAWGVFALAGGFVWARYSRAARTRPLLIVITVTALVLIDLIGGMRFVTGAAVREQGVVSSDLLGLAAINVGYLVGVVSGAVVRARESE